MKELLGIITIIISFVALLPYIRDTYRKKTVPHLFTWLTALVILVIVFFGQLTSGAGAGSWSTVSTAVLIAIVVIFAMRNKSTYAQIRPVDGIFLLASLALVIPWIVSKDATLSIILAVVIDICSMIPTLRKTIASPDSETVSTYQINVVRHILSLVALSEYNLATVLFPTYLIGVNSLMAFVILRGRSIKGI